jgi:hypothetical protein
MDDSAVHIFWDNSNVFARARDTCDKDGKAGREPGHRSHLRLHFKNLYEFAAAGRTVEKAVAVGSIPPGLQALWETLEGVGITVGLQERGAATGKEQGVDPAIQLEMMTSVLDRTTPAVAVLISGDGDFREYADRMLDKGWGVEVLCFADGFSRKLKEITRGHGGRGKYIVLDDWYEQLTYLEDEDHVLRHASALDLTGRSTV